MKESDAMNSGSRGPGTGDAHWPMWQHVGGAKQRLRFVSTEEAGSFSPWSEGVANITSVTQ